MYLCTKENIMHHPEIAIVDPNTLTCLGLKNILEDIIPMATIRVFHSFGELTDDTPDMYAHYLSLPKSILNILPSFYFVNQKQLY